MGWLTPLTALWTALPASATSPFTDASPSSSSIPALMAAPKSIEPSASLLTGWAEYAIPPWLNSSGYWTLNETRAPPPISDSGLATHSEYTSMARRPPSSKTLRPEALVTVAFLPVGR